MTLKHACFQLRNDFEIVMAAIKQNGRALQFAGRELKERRGVQIEALQHTYFALEYCTEDVQRDSVLVQLYVVSRSGYGLQHAHYSLRDHQETVLFAAVHTDGKALQYASQRLRADPEVVLAALQKCGAAIQFASEDLRADYAMVWAAVHQRGTVVCQTVIEAEIESLRDT
jgi:hypothetical protein